MSDAAAPRPARSRYERPRRPFSVLGIILGLILGVGAGLGYAWGIAPMEQSNIAPWQLDAEGRTSYTVAIALAYGQDGDLGHAIERLVALRFPGDPIQGMADIACQLASTGYANSTSGLDALVTMIRLYQLQGRAGCADQIIGANSSQSGGVVTIDLPTPTTTLTPPPSKTPTPLNNRPTPTALLFIVPTQAPQNAFDLISVTTNCSLGQSGLIMVDVYQLNGSTGIPGMEIRARWSGGESRFFTGLKSERGDSYADFTMASGIDYIIDMPGRADPIRQPLSAVPCTTPNGEQAVIAYRVLFRAAE